MANYYVYSPLTGYTTSEIENNEYCDGVGGGPHSITGGSGFDRPIDVGFLDGAPYYYSRQLDLVVSSNIQSAVFTQSTNMCSSDPGSPWNTAVDLKLYTGTGGTGSLIGTVRYGHVDGARSPGTENYPGSTTYVVGSAPLNNCGCGCYNGVHVHMEAKAGSGVTLYTTPT